MDESVNAEDLVRIISLLRDLEKHARENGVTITMISPYVEVDERPVAQLEYDSQNKTYRLRPISH